MSNAELTAHQAITRSITHSEIVTLPYDSDACVELERACDDYSESDRFEFWGTSLEGGEWRVHVLKG